MNLAKETLGFIFVIARKTYILHKDATFTLRIRAIGVDCPYAKCKFVSYANVSFRAKKKGYPQPKGGPFLRFIAPLRLVPLRKNIFFGRYKKDAPNPGGSFFEVDCPSAK